MQLKIIRCCLKCMSKYGDIILYSPTRCLNWTMCFAMCAWASRLRPSCLQRQVDWGPRLSKKYHPKSTFWPFNLKNVH